MSDIEIVQEAERLTGLNNKQLETEAVACALRLGRQSEASFDELQRIDVECLDALIGARKSAEQIVYNESKGEIITR